ncbi:MAG: hypothetical protein ABI318_20970 [Chthoniobacteraceae bacterium]
MHRSLFTAILCALALASCEPAAEKTDADAQRNDERPSKQHDSFTEYKDNHEQLSAEGSVGKSPPPRNLIAGVSDMCPVHHVKMTVCDVPVVFEESADSGTDTADPAAATAFPFGAEKVVSEGNALLPGETLTARIYQCPACVAARKAAERMRGKAALRAAAE